MCRLSSLHATTIQSLCHVKNNLATKISYWGVIFLDFRLTNGDFGKKWTLGPCRKCEKAVPCFPINSEFIHLILMILHNASGNSHSQLSAHSKETHTQCPIIRMWNGAIYGAIKHMWHTCLFGYVKINEITYKCQSN